MSEADYAELVAQAEKAVASVKDPELKRIAFQKILDQLFVPSERATPARPSTVKKTVGKNSVKRQTPKGGTQAYVSELVDEGFFKKPKTIANVKAELENRGHHIPLTSLSGPLQKLCQRKTLRRQKLKLSETKQAFAYSNW